MEQCPERTIEAAHARVAEFKADTDLIPPGPYCYRRTGEVSRTEEGLPRHKVELCPYWAVDREKPEQMNGYCAFMRMGDWMPEGTMHLWDQVKECGIEDGFEDLPDFAEEELPLPEGQGGAR